MIVYLVRRGCDREIVGLFAVQRADDLTLAIDEWCDPSGCECLKLGPGGLYRPEANAPSAPRHAQTGSENLPGWFGGSIISESWAEFLEVASWSGVVS